MGIDLKLSGSRIREVRKARKMSVQRLADIVGITEESLMHIECGARRPSYQTLYNIADALDASLDFLSGRVSRPNEYVPTPEIKESGLNEDQADTLRNIVRAIAPIIKKKV